MYSNILLPVAFDDKVDIEKPLAVAEAVRAKDARITLLHVFDALPSYALSYVPEDMLQATRDGVEAKLKSMASKIHNGTATIAEGSPGRAITDWTDAQGVDLVVMASHRPAMGDLLWGSTAAFVVRHVQCAVHVLR